MPEVEDSNVLEISYIPEAVSWGARAIRWGYGKVMARPEFVGPQQRLGGLNPGEAEWAISVRVVGGMPGIGSLKDSTIQLIPIAYEKPERWSSGTTPGFPDFNRPLGLRWQKDANSEAKEEQTLHKGRAYYIPIAAWRPASGNQPTTHLKTARFFYEDENPLGPGNYYFKVELKSGSKPIWTSEDYFQIGVPSENDNAIQFNVSVVTEEQFVERFGRRVAG